jgi:selenocysteine lyase/cysteine desulfurase
MYFSIDGCHSTCVDIRAISEMFEIPPGVTYLNCANMAPQLRSVTVVGLDAVRKKSALWALFSEDWFTGAEELRTLAGQVMGAAGSHVALVPAVSYGIAVAANNVKVKHDQSIVIAGQEFPSNVYAWRELAKRCHGQFLTVQRHSGSGWTEALLQAINEETAVVSVPQCHWTDGSSIDLIRVGERAREVGAALVIDASQSLDACPLDLDRIQPDFLVSVGYKWLLGPYGLGYLYVVPKWHENGSPLERSWLTRRGSEDFARLIDYRDDYREGARRFDMGEFPQFVLVPMASAALRQLLSWGVGAIEHRLSSLTDDIAQRAEYAGYELMPYEQRCRHMIGIRRPGGVPASLSSALLAAGVYVSVRGDFIRVAPHLYNDASDIERLFVVLASALRT